MSVADSLIAAFTADKTGWAQQPRRRLAAIRKHASRELLEAADFGPDATVSRTLTSEELFRRFHAVARDRLGRSRLHNIALDVCDEAEEVLLALGTLSPSSPAGAARPKGGNAWGRVCELCWRTEAEPRRAGAYGRCHCHDPVAAPLRGAPESEDARETRLQVRNAIDRAQRLRRASAPEHLNPRGYPLLPPRPAMPDFSKVAWRHFVQEHFPLSALLLRPKGDHAVATFQSTVAALEDRPLRDHERAELAGEIDALPTLLRSEAWMGLVQAAAYELPSRRRSRGSGDGFGLT